MNIGNSGIEMREKPLENREGVELNEIKETRMPDSVTIKPDIELIKDKTIESIVAYNTQDEVIEIQEKGEPIENKKEGIRRENEVNEELIKEYPEDEGYTIESEVYLRDKDGNIVKDHETGEARRIDFVVINDGEVVDSIEVTSKTADKVEQSDKEARIRENGGNYIKDSNGKLVEIPISLETRIERRD